MSLPKEEFLHLVKVAHKETIFKIKDNHFFTFDGIIFSTNECEDNDFAVVITGYRLNSTPPYGYDMKKIRKMKRKR